MALCDQLEASLATGEATRCRLLGTLLHEALAPSVEATASAPVPERQSNSADAEIAQEILESC